LANTGIGTAERPLRIAIIGAGPAGFYAAESLLKKTDLTVSIDFINRFPTPFGLVRDGVAPDHPSIKSVSRAFDKILADPRVRFFGNVTYGVDLHHHDLHRFYDQIIFAVGAQSDRRMGIEGEDLPNSFPATAFVGWYNGHPDYRDLPLDLSVERAVVVGNGNVAMDVARILVAPPEELAKTDIADHALAGLRESKIREVVLLGRRGAAQASFTHPELKEFGKLAGVDVIVDPQNIALDALSEAAIQDDRTALANIELLRTYAANTDYHGERRIVLRFLASPIEIIAENGKMTAIKIERNQLSVDANGSQRAKGTGEHEIIPTGLVLRSIGYRSMPIEGVPFNDETYTISNLVGRVSHPNTSEPVVGEYVVGWAKRGPSGLIGNNKPDSVATVAAMIEDIETLPGAPESDPTAIENFLREHGVDFVSIADWQKLDQFEIARGAAQGRPRVKLTTVPEMLRVIRS